MAAEPKYEYRAQVTERSLTQWLWDTAQSVRTTIYILPAIAVASTIGALVPQKRPPEYYTMLYGAKRGWVITHLGLDHLYTSTWFLVLIALLLVNLAACAFRSWRRATREYRGPTPEALARKLRGPRAASCWFGRTSASGVEQRVAEGLRGAHCAVHVTEEAGCRRIVARRWSWAAYGRIVTHLAIFLVALGAVLGMLPGTSLDEDVTIQAGGTWQDRGKLGFDVRLDKFRMDYYPGTSTPSLYASDVTLLSNGAEVGKGTATVNKSLVHAGVSLGQSSWGLAGVRLTVTSKGGAQEPVVLSLAPSADAMGNQVWDLDEQGRVAFLSDRKWALVANAFVLDAVQRNGEIVGSASEYPRNPAILLQGVSGLDAGKHQFHQFGWLRRGSTVTFGDHAVRFADVIYTSTLSARKDMGLPLVWAGFILVTLGMVVMFYLRPRTFLVELSPTGRAGETRIAVAPSGRELLDADRQLIEQACQTELKQGNGSR